VDIPCMKELEWPKQPNKTWYSFTPLVGTLVDIELQMI